MPAVCIRRRPERECLFEPRTVTQLTAIVVQRSYIARVPNE